MASTYRPVDAFDMSKVFIKLMPLERSRQIILDSALKMLWMSAPWRWSLGAFPTVTLAASATDYAVTDPADFLYIQPGSAYVSAGETDVARDIEVVAAIPAQVKIVGAQPSLVTHPSANVVRIFPKPSATVTSGTQLISLYKKICPVLSESNIYTAGVQVFDDEWFWVYVSIVLYQAYLYADDSRAGAAQFTEGGGRVYTGQRGIVEANLRLMRESEPLLVQKSPPVGVGKKER